MKLRDQDREAIRQLKKRMDFVLVFVWHGVIAAVKLRGYGLF